MRIGWSWLTTAAAVLFALETYWVVTQHLLPFDLPVALFVQGATWGPLTYVFELINADAGWIQAATATLAVVVVFVWFDRRAALLMVMASVASLLDYQTTILIARPRPSADLVHVVLPASGYSYPSGHAVLFTWLSVTLAYAIAPRVPQRWRWIVWVLAGMLILLVCCARVWAGDHWPSDVVAGVLLGFGWSAAMIWARTSAIQRP